MVISRVEEFYTNVMAEQLTIIVVETVILLGIMLIFFLYYRASRQQIQKLEKAEREAVQANKAKSEFLSSMSHDIRTPMNGIVGMTAIAMANINDTGKVEDCLVKISLSSKHLLGLINDVLDISKIESGKLSLNMTQVSLRETMESIVNIVQPQIKERKQHFDISIQKIQTEEVYCDSVRLNQVLINLLSNALKFTPEGGRINVYLEQEASPKGDSFVRCHFRVKDNGMGMTPEFQEKIFETFSREEKIQVDRIEGTGLGMAITKAIVDTMGGTIELHSEPEKGTEFHITLDLEKAETKEDMVLPPWKMPDKTPEEDKKDDLQDFSGMRILLSEDNDLNWEIAEDILSEVGFELERAENGQICVDKFSRSQVGYYDIILMDIRMPVMDGYEASKIIRSLNRPDVNLPIIAMTADAFSDDIHKCLECGMNEHVAKPIEVDRLTEILKKYLIK